MLLRALLLMMVLVSNAFADDAVLNLVDPNATSPLSPTLRIRGIENNNIPPQYRLPVSICEVVAVAPTLTAGTAAPCYVNTSGSLLSSGGGGGGGDVNIIEILGVAPSETNPLPGRLSTGVAYYDARDRNWTLNSGTDSVTVSGTVTANQGGVWNIGSLTSITNPVAVIQSGVWSVGRTWTLDSATDNVAVSGTVGVSNAFLLDATFTGRINTLGQKTMVNSTPVVLPSDQSAIPVSQSGSWTVTSNNSTVGSANNDGACPSGAANFTVAASNASRTWLALWASPANTDDVYIKLGATATTSDARIAPGQPINFVSGRIYTGQIDAIPASGTQAVCLMELN